MPRFALRKCKALTLGNGIPLFDLHTATPLAVVHSPPSLDLVWGVALTAALSLPSRALRVGAALAGVRVATLPAPRIQSRRGSLPDAEAAGSLRHLTPGADTQLDIRGLAVHWLQHTRPPRQLVTARTRCCRLRQRGQYIPPSVSLPHSSAAQRGRSVSRA